MKVPATERAGTSQPNQKVYNTAAGGENDFAAGKAQGAQIAKKRALPGGVTDSLTSWSEAGWPGKVPNKPLSSQSCHFLQRSGLLE